MPAESVRGMRQRFALVALTELLFGSFCASISARRKYTSLLFSHSVDKFYLTPIFYDPTTAVWVRAVAALACPVGFETFFRLAREAVETVAFVVVRVVEFHRRWRFDPFGKRLTWLSGGRKLGLGLN